MAEEATAEIVTDETPLEENNQEPQIVVDEPPKKENETPKEENESVADIEEPENKEEQKITNGSEKQTPEQNGEHRTDTLEPEPDLDKTTSTDEVESKAAKQLSQDSLDLSQFSRSIFDNEGRWAGLWLVFTATV